MENKKGYIVLETGFEYDDESYSTGNYGPTYEQPKKMFLDKEKAFVFWKKQSMEKLRGLTLGLYVGGDPDQLCKKDMVDKFYQIMKELGSDEDDYEMQIPDTATYEQLEQLIECLKIEFFKVVEIDIE
jgi:hypothetical protein